MGRGQWDKSVSLLEKVLHEEPQDVRTMLKLGDVYAKKGDREQAMDVYQKVAEHHATQGFFLKAVAVYKQILKLDNRNGVAALRIAELHEQLGLAQDALVHFQLALPILEEQGLTDQALAVLQRILDIDSENVAARIKLAESYSRLNDRPHAVQHFTLAAQVLKQQGRIEDYVKVAERLIYHEPQRLDVVKDLAKLYLSRGDTKRGLAKLQICFREIPRDIETLTLLAQAFSNLDQVQKTVYVYRELARVHEDEGRQAEAREVHRLILQHHPDDQESLRALGMLEDQPGAHAQAPEALDVDLHVEEPVDAFSFPTPPVPENATGALPLHATQDILRAATDPSFAVSGSHNRSFPFSPKETHTASHMASSRRRSSVNARLGQSSSSYVKSFPSASSSTSLPHILHHQSEVEATAPLTVYTEKVSPPRISSPYSMNLPADEHVERIIKEAEVYIRYSLPGKALEHLEQGYHINPDHPLLYRRAYDAWLALRDHERAACAIGKAFLVFQAKGDHNAAGEARKLLVTLDPHHPSLSVNHVPLSSAVEIFRHRPETTVEDIDVDTDEFGSSDEAPLFENPLLRSKSNASIPLTIQAPHPPPSPAPSIRSKDIDPETAAALSTPVGSQTILDPINSSKAAKRDAEQAESASPSLPARKKGQQTHPSSEAKAREAATNPSKASHSAGEASKDLYLSYLSSPPSAEERRSEDAKLPADDISSPESLSLADAVAALEADGPDDGDSDTTLDDELAEIGFYVDAELYDDARSALEDFERSFPNHPRLDEYRALVESGDPKAIAALTIGSSSPPDANPKNNDLAPSASSTTEHSPQSSTSIAQSEPNKSAGSAPYPLVAPDEAPHLPTPSETKDEGALVFEEDDAEILLAVWNGEKRSQQEPLGTSSNSTAPANEHYDQGMAHKQIGQLEEAVAAFHKAADTSPDRAADALEMLGHCLVEQSKLSEAVEIFQQALKLCVDEPASINLHYEIGHAYELMQDFALARTWFESCRKRAPNHRNVATRLLNLPKESISENVPEPPKKQSKINYI